jgi:8-oxo-dGTP pyrophosphatase MutT (NUDIX family)
MFKINVKLSDNSKIEVEIDRPELLYGATALVSNIYHNCKAINPVTNNEMEIMDTGENKTRFFIPSHIQKDYEYAIKNNMSLKQVVFPYFHRTGEQAPRDDKPTQKRHSIVAIIRNPKTNEYLCEDAKGRDCKSFIMGGIEDGESIEEAALREIKEETGYEDVSIDRISDISIINHFYAAYKNVNRFARLEFVFGELNSDLHNSISQEEQEKHNLVWIKKEDLKNFINIDHNLYAIETWLNENSAFTGDGLMIIDDAHDYGMTSEEAREYVVSKLSNRV